MKLKLLVKMLEKLLGAARGEEENPADMYLPERLLAMALVFFGAAVAALVIAVVKGNAIGWFAGAAAALVLAVSACLCWKNQKIHVLSDDEFSYTTMFGKTTVYKFEDIVALRRNKDSFTLMLKSGKVHIESMAVLSERLIKRINAVFEKAE